ncbi:hypothetical protein A9Q79_02680 [Methylophaga sp. 42_25_T18]|nr:hypothetical protein A9Q79_02680 [Methylophaga sp. 42_25_T18]
MSKIEFSPVEKEVLITQIQAYFNAELNQDIEQFDTEFLLDFFTDKVGAYFYNKGLADAQAVLEEKVDNIKEAIYEIEQPTEFSRYLQSEKRK